MTLADADPDVLDGIIRVPIHRQDAAILLSDLSAGVLDILADMLARDSGRCINP